MGTLVLPVGREAFRAALRISAAVAGALVLWFVVARPSTASFEARSGSVARPPRPSADVPAISEVLQGVRGGAGPWILAACALTARGPIGPAAQRTILGLLDQFLGNTSLALSTLPNLAMPHEPGVHPIEIGGVRGTLAVTEPGPQDRSRKFVIGARGGSWGFVISGCGVAFPENPICETGGPRPVTEIVTGRLSVSWTPPSQPLGDRGKWSLLLTVSGSDPLRWIPPGTLAGTVLITVTAPDGRSGDVTLEAGPFGPVVRGTWPAAEMVDEEISTVENRISIRGSTPVPGQERTVEFGADGSLPLQVRATRRDPTGGARNFIQFEMRPMSVVTGSWENLAANPARAGSFRVLPDGLVQVSDEWGRATTDRIGLSDEE